MNKSISDWFLELKEPYQTKAFNNLLPHRYNIKRNSLAEAISAGFSWSYTLEGHEYWAMIAKTLNQDPNSPEYAINNETKDIDVLHKTVINTNSKFIKGYIN
jgi:hypothetical protein